jgi:hypothetical protein
MEYTVTLTLSPVVYQVAAQRAQETNRTIEQVLTEQLQTTLQPFPSLHISPNRAAMLREVEAYHTLHPLLVKTWLGHYVAIYQGQLVDHDPDEAALLERKRRAYPGQVVLVRRVEAEPEPTLALHSLRF